MRPKIPFVSAISKNEKTRIGRSDVWTMPLALRCRMKLDDAERAEVRRQLGRKLENFAQHIERVSVRFEDANGPRGGVDAICRVKIVLRALPSVVVEERAVDALGALGRAAAVAGRTVRRTLRRAGWSAPRAGRGGEKPAPAGRVAPRGAILPDDQGSLICGRVGRGKANLERALARPEKRRRDVPVDTAAPGVNASDRRAGFGATAARNTKRNTAGMAAALEDSRTTPSRKSTRKSKNRAKGAALLERKAQLRLQTPIARATRNKALRGSSKVK
ncbi:MAG: hypothetical protein ABI629_14560 [bacterium]